MNTARHEQHERDSLALLVELQNRVNELESALRTLLNVPEEVELRWGDARLTNEFENALDAAKDALRRPAREAQAAKDAGENAAMWRRANALIAAEIAANNQHIKP